MTETKHEIVPLAKYRTMEYVSQQISIKYKGRTRTVEMTDAPRPIGGMYNCMSCAECDLFELDGEFTEYEFYDDKEKWRDRRRRVRAKWASKKQ